MKLLSLKRLGIIVPSSQCERFDQSAHLAPAASESRELCEISYENDVPQPHDFFAFGFWKTKPWCMRLSS